MAADLQDPQNSVSEPTTFPKRDFRQEVTDQIIEMLEKGTAPWQTPWEPGALQLPHNPTTNRAYRGGNALHLMAVGARKSCPSSNPYMSDSNLGNWLVPIMQSRRTRNGGLNSR